MSVTLSDWSTCWRKRGVKSSMLLLRLLLVVQTVVLLTLYLYSRISHLPQRLQEEDHLLADAPPEDANSRHDRHCRFCSRAIWIHLNLKIWKLKFSWHAFRSFRMYDIIIWFCWSVMACQGLVQMASPLKASLRMPSSFWGTWRWCALWFASVLEKGLIIASQNPYWWLELIRNFRELNWVWSLSLGY